MLAAVHGTLDGSLSANVILAIARFASQAALGRSPTGQEDLNRVGPHARRLALGNCRSQPSPPAAPGTDPPASRQYSLAAPPVLTDLAPHERRAVAVATISRLCSPMPPGTESRDVGPGGGG